MSVCTNRYTQFVYLFIYWRTSRFISTFDNYKYSCYKHSYAGLCVGKNFWCIWVNTKELIVGLYGKSIFRFVRNCRLFSKEAIFAFLPTINETPCLVPFSGYNDSPLNIYSYITLCFLRLVFSSQHSLLLTLWSHNIWENPYTTSHSTRLWNDTPATPLMWVSVPLCISKQCV